MRSLTHYLRVRTAKAKGALRARAPLSIAQLKRKPVLAIDARSAQQSGYGVATYSTGLISHLHTLTSKYDFVFVVEKGKDIPTNIFPPNSRFLETAAGKGDIWTRDLFEQVVLPARLSRLHVDLYHGLDYYIPIVRTPFLKVATFHDACVFTPEDDRSRISRARLTFLLRRMADSADAIVTDSEYSRVQLGRYLQSTRHKTTAIWCGLLDEFVSPETQDVDQGVDHLSLNTEFILYYGGYAKRKRVDLLLQAFQRVRSLKSVSLVLVGEIEGKKRERLQNVVAALGLTDAVTFFGFATRTQLRELLQRCAAFVFPSAMEGFGLPVAEALASGAAVVCSRAGSLPEIGGNAVRYFTVPDAAELSAAILDVLDNAALRQQLRANASRRAGDFTWCRHLDQLHLVYDGLLRRER